MQRPAGETDFTGETMETSEVNAEPILPENSKTVDLPQSVQSVKTGAKERLRLLLVGLQGVGKSAAANTILGREEFESDVSSICVTMQSKSSEGVVCGRQVTVVDTPGLFNAALSDRELKEELDRALELCDPGPHVFLITIQLGRFSEEEIRVMEKLSEILGPNFNLSSMVLFTGGDKLNKKNIDEFVKADINLLKLISKCGGRYHVFNNTVTGNEAQVSKLLDKIDQMDGRGKYRFYVKCLPQPKISVRLWEILQETGSRKEVIAAVGILVIVGLGGLYLKKKWQKK